MITWLTMFSLTFGEISRRLSGIDSSHQRWLQAHVMISCECTLWYPVSFWLVCEWWQKCICRGWFTYADRANCCTSPCQLSILSLVSFIILSGWEIDSRKYVLVLLRCCSCRIEWWWFLWLWNWCYYGEPRTGFGKICAQRNSLSFLDW
jgi:hypothetical protein